MLAGFEDKAVFCWFWVFMIVNKCVCDNTTFRYLKSDRREGTRQQRLITFDTEEDGEVKVELDFAVPFVRIPVKKSLEMGKSALANVDVTSVLFAGGVVFTLGTLVPKLFVLLSDKPGRQRQKGERLDDDEVAFSRVFAYADGFLRKNGVDSVACLQRFLCLTVKSSAANVLRGGASSGDKIVDGVSTSDWLRRFIVGTPLDVAIRNGVEGANCLKEHHACRLSQKTLQELKDQLLNLIL